MKTYDKIWFVSLQLSQRMKFDTIK